MPVRVDHDGPVTVVAIDRPDRRNAVDGPTAQELVDAFRAFEADDGHAVAILEGTGGHFCAGADLKEFSNRFEPDGDGPMGPTRLRLSKPVIAAIEGSAVAGGFELALWCDLRVAAEDAVLGVFNRRWGIPLVDGGTFRLPRLVGQSRALDLILTGRPVYGAEAYEIGLVNRLAAPGEAHSVAVVLAHDIARFPQACMRSDRASALEQWSLDEDSAFENEFSYGAQAIRSGQAQAGAARFAEGKGRHGSFDDIG